MKKKTRLYYGLAYKLFGLSLFILLCVFALKWYDWRLLVLFCISTWANNIQKS